MGEGAGEAEALTEGVMHGPGVLVARYINTMLAPTPSRWTADCLQGRIAIEDVAR